jgi:hypothetical protein
VVGQEAQEESVEDRQDVGGADKEVEGVHREERLRDGLHVRRDEEEGGHHDHPEQHQLLETKPQVGVHGL